MLLLRLLLQRLILLLEWQYLLDSMETDETGFSPASFVAGRGGVSVSVGSVRAPSSGKEGRKDPRESDEESSSTSESTEDSSMGVHPPESIIVGKQIRQHARELLQSTSERDSCESENNISVHVERASNLTRQSNNYQSYHDAPPSTREISSSSFTNPDATTATPPWATRDHGNSDDGGMSMTDIATMAFSCVSRCLTEGYRAASNYYGTYQQDPYPGPMTGIQNYYQHVASYHNEAYDHVRTNMNGYNDNHQTFSSSIPSKNGFEIGDREVMERGITSSIGNEKSRQTPGEQTSRKEEWETFQVPSSYQGGRVGG